MRALLLAYPLRMRRRHGAELIATLTDLAGPSGRVDRSARRQFVLDGLRERFRLPAGRPTAVVAAVLALIAGGALGAAGGAFAATSGYADLPAPAAMAQRLSVPGSTPISRGASDHYLGINDTLPAGADPAAVAERTRQRLVADGWSVEPVTIDDAAHFKAERGGIELSVYAYGGEMRLRQIAGWPLRPAGFGWLLGGGLLLGLLTGWLLAASMAHRIVASGRPRVNAGLAVGGLVALLVPATAFAVSLWWYLMKAGSTGMGGLLRPDVWGLSGDAARGLGLTGPPAVDQTHWLLTFLGVAALATAGVLTRRQQDWVRGREAAGPGS
ncbi:hypothetical protein [Actinoplanes sp. NBRC 103695]|uniref:hypothetical protein n=1 Tax=Actinoplanes sp. NBRC 103695 TaxID=3032202 RepID=UPI0024A50144|nr:hypothetical protein [Actinoplanes sp. NBRC 103695]GLY99592.1 hypothetical protein Acsp02_68450 [Actinoplanes sp. NBRC 103695]